MKDLFQYSALPLADFLSEAANTKDHLIKYKLCPATERLVSDLEKEGVSIDSSFNHVLDNYAIRHILMKHANKKELLRGQILIRLEDFLLLPEVLFFYDSLSIENRDGRTGLLYRKEYPDGTNFYLEEVRNGRLELAAVTFFKRKRKLTGANS